jgi:hypothetical protein
MKKKIYYLLAFSGIAVAGLAQTQRMVLAEEFTQASCGPCAAQNPAFNTLLAGNTNKVVSLKYQTSWPGVDPMNAQNATDVATRVTYYNVTGVPYAPIDGSETPVSSPNYAGAPANWTQSIIDAAYGVNSPFDLQVTHTMSSDFDSAFVTVVITATQAFTSNGTLKLQLAMAEKEIDFATAPGTNGETEFYMVMRKMYPSASGTTLASTWSNTTTQTLTFAVAVPNYIYNISEVVFVGFIQDDGNKAVQQTGMSQPVLVANDAGATTVSNLGAFTCNTNFTPMVDIKNFGSATLTSATINYQIDTQTPMTYSWSGSLASGATTTATLPAMTLTAGSHTFTVWTSNPNAVADYNGANDQSMQNFSVVGTYIPAPYTTNFSTASFPYTNWILSNPDNGLTWARVATGGGAMKMDHWNYQGSGQIDEIVVSPMDLSTASAASFQFDLAYAYYTDANGDLTDSLYVQVSTDCGATWTTLYYDGGVNMATGGAVSSGAFVPTAAQWTTKCFSLQNYVGQSAVLIKLVSVNGYGNDLWIDNLAVNNAACAVGVNDPIATTSVSIYPNPFDKNANIQVTLAGTEQVVVEIYSMTGELVSSKNYGDLSAGEHNLAIDGTNLSDGMYFVTVRTGSTSTTSKITVSH